MSSSDIYDRILGFLALATRPFVRVKITGLEHIPSEAGAIIVLNHISLMDPVIFGVAVRKQRQIRALAKESLFRKPIIGEAMTAMKHIPVMRGSYAASNSLYLATKKLQAGELIGIYPEGTIPETLGELGPFKSGAARLALESRVPVIPVATWGVQEALPRNGGKKRALFKALFTRPMHRIVIGAPMGPFKGDQEDFEEVNEVTAEIREAIEQLLPLAKERGKKSSDKAVELASI